MGEPIDKETLADMKRVFRFYDMDSDGLIDTKFLGVLVRSMGKCVSESDLRAIVEKLNAFEEGVFNFDGFVTAMEYPTHKDSKEELLNSFKVLDPTSSGCINVNALRSDLTTRGEELTNAEFNAFIAEMPTNPDNTINYEDVVDMLLESE